MKKLFLIVTMLLVVNGVSVAQEPDLAVPEPEPVVEGERSVIKRDRIRRRRVRRQDGEIIEVRGPCAVVRGAGRYVLDVGGRITNGACDIIKAPFEAEFRLPRPRRFLYQKPIWIPGRLIPLDRRRKTLSPSEVPEVPSVNPSSDSENTNISYPQDEHTSSEVLFTVANW